MPGDKSGSDVFLSYASEDFTRVKPLVAGLLKAGVSVFWDRVIPPTLTWRDVLERELQRARCLVVVWSRVSTASRWVVAEADEAAERGIMVSVRLDPIAPPLGFREEQALDLIDWDGDCTDPRWLALLDVLKDRVEGRIASPHGTRHAIQETALKGYRRIYYENFSIAASVNTELWLQGNRGDWTGTMLNGSYELSNSSGHETASYTSIFTYLEGPGDDAVDQSNARVTMTLRLEGALSKDAAGGILYRASRDPARYLAFTLASGNTLCWFEGSDSRLRVLGSLELSAFKDGQDAQLRVDSSPDQIRLYLADKLVQRLNHGAGMTGSPGVFAMGRGRFLFSNMSVHLPSN